MRFAKELVKLWVNPPDQVVGIFENRGADPKKRLQWNSEFELNGGKKCVGLVIW